jgi:hypothetical protein
MEGLKNSGKDDPNNKKISNLCLDYNVCVFTEKPAV